MGGQYKINSTTYNIVGGKYKTNNKIYNIVGGKYKSGGAIYDISFGPIVTPPMPKVLKGGLSSVRFSSPNPFTITIEGKSSSNYLDALQVSRNASSFTTLLDATEYSAKEYADGYALYLRGNNGQIFSSTSLHSRIIINGSDVSMSGNLANLFWCDDITKWTTGGGKAKLFYYMFAYNYSLVDCSDAIVPILNLESSYAYMFQGCKNLEYPPLFNYGSQKNTTGTRVNSSTLFRDIYSGCSSLKVFPASIFTRALSNGPSCYYQTFDYASWSAGGFKQTYSNIRLYTSPTTVTDALGTHSYTLPISNTLFFDGTPRNLSSFSYFAIVNKSEAQVGNTNSLYDFGDKTTQFYIDNKFNGHFDTDYTYEDW